MRCERCNCGKAKEYMVDLTDGQSKSVHLCRRCYEKDMDIQPYVKILKLFSQVLLQMLNQCVRMKVFNILNTADTVYPMRCETCGLSWVQYQKMKHPTCPLCISSFRTIKQNILKERSVQREDVISDKKSENLYQAISTGQFETAAECIDLIDEMRKVYNGGIE